MASHASQDNLNRLGTTDSGGASFAGASDQHDEISLLDLLILISARKRLIVQVAAGFILAALILAFLLPVEYKATVTLLPPQQNSSLGAQLAAQLGSLGGLAQMAGGGGSLLKNPNDMFVAMFKSRSVEDAMIQRFGLMQEYHKKYLSDTRTAFEKHVVVDGSGKDGLIHISVEDRDPKRAAAMANGYIDAFRGLSQNLAITEAQQRRLFFENQLQQANLKLADAENALEQTERKTGVIAFDSQARALVESAANLRAQIAAKEVQIQSIETYVTGENAQLVQAQQELATLRDQLAKLGGNGDNPDSIIVPKGQMTTASLEYVRRLRDVKYYETIFDILARQFELAKLDEAKEGSTIQVVDPATIPDKKSSPHRALIVIGAAVLGLFVGILCSLCLAALERLKSDRETFTKLNTLRQSLSIRKG